MSAWPLVALDEVFEIARGGSPRPIEAYITEDVAGINWVMIGDASAGSKYITSTKKRIRPEGAKRSRSVKPGDFLLTNSMSFGKPYIMRTDGCIHDGWLVLSPRKGNVHPDFFYHLLGSDAVYSEFERRAAGATVKNLNIDLVKSVKVAVPSLQEQRRIAEVLDRAEALRAKRRAALAQLDSLTQSIFLDMFGDPVTNPKAWTTQPFDFAMADETSKSMKLPQSDFNKDGAYPVIDQGQASIAGYCDDPAYLCVSELPAIVFGDHTRIVKYVDHPFVIGADGAKVLAPSREVTARYLCWLLRMSSIPNLGYSRHMREVKRLGYMIPPLPLQQTFARRVTAIEALKTTHRAALAELDALFASLQHRAFRGEL